MGAAALRRAARRARAARWTPSGASGGMLSRRGGGGGSCSPAASRGGRVARCRQQLQPSRGRGAPDASRRAEDSRIAGWPRRSHRLRPPPGCGCGVLAAAPPGCGDDSDSLLTNQQHERLAIEIYVACCRDAAQLDAVC